MFVRFSFFKDEYKIFYLQIYNFFMVSLYLLLPLTRKAYCWGRGSLWPPRMIYIYKLYKVEKGVLGHIILRFSVDRHVSALCRSQCEGFYYVIITS